MRTALWITLALSATSLGNWAAQAAGTTKPAAPATPKNAQSFAAGMSDPRAKTNWKQVFDQLFYWNIGKFPRCDEFTPSVLRHNAMYYSPQDFNSLYNSIVNNVSNGDGSALEQSREGLMAVPKTGSWALSSPNSPSMKAGIASVASSGSPASDFASLLLGEMSNPKTDKTYYWKTNFFKTPEGQKVMEKLKDVTIVVVPGFGSHTIPYYTYAEIVKDANLYYGRTYQGERKDEDGKPLLGEPIRLVDEQNDQPKYDPGQKPGEFYAHHDGAPELGFDVVHPMGRELGNTMGEDGQAADALAGFVNSLPPEYAQKKLIFLGYSKGTPVSHNMLFRSTWKEIRKRTLAIVTLAGVNQGAITAEDGIQSLKLAEEEANKEQGKQDTNVTMQQAVDSVTDPNYGVKNLTMKGLFTARSTVNEELAKKQDLGQKGIETLFAMATAADRFSSQQGDDQVKSSLANTLDKVDAKQAEIGADLHGVLDMTNYNRLRWNLLNLSSDNPEVPDTELSVLSLSVLTNQGDWAYPEKSLAFQWDAIKANALDIARYSLDNLFLLATSITGFDGSPGGLFDTQVAWLDTKPMPLDNRSLAKSLTDAELGDLAKEVNADRQSKGLTALPTNFGSMPRNQLFEMTRHRDNLNFVDLGEFRGTHWDISFEQVYRFKSDPGAASGVSVELQNKPGETSAQETGTSCRTDRNAKVNPDGYLGYEHIFPRKAMLASLFETLSLYIDSAKK